jgi:copper resistance protein D
MEHSLLHAVLLCGTIVVAGGPLLVLWLLRPALNRNSPTALAHGIELSADTWVMRASLVSSIAIIADLFVQVAEAHGSTVFAGVNVVEVVQFGFGTTVGKIALLRIAVFLVIVWLAHSVLRSKWKVTALLSGVAIVLTALVSHAAAQPTGRALAIVFETAHIAGAALWLGTLFHLLAVRTPIERAVDAESTAVVARMVERFSPIALAMVAILLMSGILAACRFVGSGRALTTSAYGLTLIVKLALLVFALFAGLLNHFIIRPGLFAVRKNREAIPVLNQFGRNLELEVTAGLLVVAVAGILAAISPPAENVALELTHRQETALVRPRVPSLVMPDPKKFYGATERTSADLAYSEFTHHFSGFAVLLLGACWLAQSGRSSKVAAKVWPLLLIPFAIFIATFADPEVWWLRRVPISSAISDPQLLEHQLGAAIVLLLAWLGWRDQRSDEKLRPLGYALPVILIIGSLLLLGHAHSTFSTNNELANLINVQHAVFGTFGLFAGVVRWLSLRGLMPNSIARWTWPLLVIGLGLFMSFYYRELV